MLLYTNKQQTRVSFQACLMLHMAADMVSSISADFRLVIMSDDYSMPDLQCTQVHDLLTFLSASPAESLYVLIGCQGRDCMWEALRRMWAELLLKSGQKNKNHSGNFRSLLG